MDIEKFEENIGKKCKKRPLDDKNIGKYKLKPFKSGFKVNTIAGVIEHPKLKGRMAYTFEEDESYVECRRCEVIKPKVKVKTKEEINLSMPIAPKGYWWKSPVSNLIYFFAMFIPVYLIFISLSILGFTKIAFIFSCITMVTVLFLSMLMTDNTKKMFSDRYFKIHYYKKRKQVWNKWWYATSKHIQYLEYKKKHNL